MVAETKSAPPIPHELAAAIESERRRADVAGAGVAAFDRDGMLFTGGFGYADIGRGEPVTRDTLFRAASIRKLFTTTLVLQEVEAGRISLSQSVNFYLDARARLRNKRGSQADDVPYNICSLTRLAFLYPGAVLNTAHSHTSSS